MDPFFEFQRGLLFHVFVYWGIAVALAGSMRYLVRNAEAWKNRVIDVLFPDASETFAEQVLLPLEFSPCCPNCERPMVERRTRNIRNGSSFRWECAFSECRESRIELRKVNRIGDRSPGRGVTTRLKPAFDVSVVWTSAGQKAA
jgi:hypothetical protein